MKTSKRWRHHLRSVFLVTTLLGGCEREMLEHICTPVESGELVISELRGSQSEVDTYGQWIELHNRSATTLNIGGIRIHLHDIADDALSDPKVIMVRDEGLTVEPGGYVVLGWQRPDQLPDHVDYGYEEDYASNFSASGQIALYVCNELVDYVVYQNLPTVGSLAFDGDLELTVDANDNANPTDVESNWCNDASPVNNPTEVGTPGTPGEQNRPCN